LKAERWPLMRKCEGPLLLVKLFLKGKAAGR